MPRYEFDPSKTQATIEVFPKDDYEVILGSPKSFIRKARAGHDSIGVRFSVEIAEGDYRGKKTVYTCYLHNEGSQSMTKRFQMAVFGFANNAAAEKEFDVAVAGQDWSIDPENGSCGEAWQKMAGARVVMSVDVEINKETQEPQQNFKSWRPIAKA